MSTFVITYALILLLLPYGNTHPDPRKTSKSKLRQTSVEVPENIVIPGVIVGGDTKYGSMKEKPHFGKAVSPSDVMDQIINILETKSGTTTESVVTISPTTKVYNPVAVKNKDPKVVLEHLEDIISALKHLSKEAKKNEESDKGDEDKKEREEDKKDEDKKEKEEDKQERDEKKKEKEEDKKERDEDKKEKEDTRKMTKIIRKLIYRHRNMR
ncbi:nucleolar protein 58-like [Ctenocephalides felis]|uniref:nucleolar protein 58-like n=1 Tax=Ctenocephalides felis TaxID=7515 RepID=UPI000E6E36CD|nr:nucleolar protein 58-like [Ctenocephalides felis]